MKNSRLSVQPPGLAGAITPLALTLAATVLLAYVGGVAALVALPGILLAAA